MVLVNGFSKWFFILVSNLVLVKVLVNGFLEKTVMCLAHERDFGAEGAFYCQRRFVKTFCIVL